MQSLRTNNVIEQERVCWSNKDNDNFYEAIKAGGLREFAKKAGLTTGCDMFALLPYWIKAKSILEVGAGYGRTIDYLLKCQFQGKITAIERCNVLFEHLKAQFSSYENTHLLHASIHHLNQHFKERFDLILYMWSGIADFPKTEQCLVVKKLAELLQPKGTLIIDTLPTHVTPLGSLKSGKQSYTIRLNNVVKYIYEPNSDEIKKYAQEAGFSRIERITCITNTQRKRWLHILS